jgi:hypothetical protein
VDSVVIGGDSIRLGLLEMEVLLWPEALLTSACTIVSHSIVLAIEGMFVIYNRSFCFSYGDVCSTELRLVSYGLLILIDELKDVE